MGTYPSGKATKESRRLKSCKSRMPLADEKKGVGEEGCVRWVIGDILFLILVGGIQGLLLLYHRGHFTHIHMLRGKKL